MRSFRWDGNHVDTPEPEPGPNTRAELEEALTNLAHTAARLPAHWADKRAAIHLRIDELLTLREAML